MIKKHQILLVEDNEDEIAMTQRALRKGNILNELVVARDGAQALDLLFDEAAPWPPTLILLDLRLPKVSGMEVLEQLHDHQKTKNFPVVVLTTSQHEDEQVENYPHDVSEFVRKPVRFDRLSEALIALGLYLQVARPAAMNR